MKIVGTPKWRLRSELWKDVENSAIEPPYPYDASATPFKTYVFFFNDTWGDGVRIIGRNGGMERFTSIADLKVFYQLSVCERAPINASGHGGGVFNRSGARGSVGSGAASDSSVGEIGG